MTIEVTTPELRDVLMSVENGTFCFLHMETKVRMNKTNNPFFDQVTKVTKGNVLVGVSYQRRGQTETGDVNFTPEECKVGTHISKCVLHNEKTGKDYLQYEWFNKVTPKSEYVFNGDRIEKEIFESYMVKYTPNKYGINSQTVTLSNIKECHINGNQYVVVNPTVEVGVSEVGIPTEV